MVWKKLWKLNIPPKVRMFTWRACSNILPTKVNLAPKKIQVDPKCTTCTQQDETICHVLWQCSLARNIRALVRGKIQKSCSSEENFFDLTAQMMDRLSKWELEQWLMICWSLWNARNQAQFDKMHSHPIAIVQSATSLLEEYQRLASSLPPN